jgi:predicted nucleic acid-binding protein
MAINYNIQAEVIDIQSDLPKSDDIFLVDTNVWYWLTYTNASISAVPYQINSYSSYIAQAISNNSLLLYSGLSLSELAHNIEQTERQIFSSTIKAKEYRHNYPTERANVVAEIETAWNQVTSIAVSADINIDEKITQNTLKRFSNQLLDGYDLMILEIMNKANIKQIITDDGDYVTVPNLQVFTANRNVITTARNQGKLIIR